MTSPPPKKKILSPERFLRFCCDALEFSSKCHESVRKSLYYGIVNKQFDSLSVSHKLFRIFSEQIDWTSLFFMFLSSFSVKLGKNMKNGLQRSPPPPQRIVMGELRCISYNLFTKNTKSFVGNRYSVKIFFHNVTVWTPFYIFAAFRWKSGA